MPIITDINHSPTQDHVPQTRYLPNKQIKLQFESKTELMAIDFANMRDPFQELHIGSSILSWTIGDGRIRLSKIGVLDAPVDEWRNDYRVQIYAGDILVEDRQEVKFAKDDFIKINGILIDFDAMQEGEGVCVRFWTKAARNVGPHRDIVGRHNTIVMRVEAPPPYE